MSWNASNGTLAALGRKAGSPKVRRNLPRYEKMLAWEEDPRIVKLIANRFWSGVEIKKKHECWPWLRDRSPRGYGRITICGDVWSSNRVAYWIKHKRLNPDLHVLHDCDNPCCCNPNHLLQGTDKDNAEHKVSKGRQLRGDNHPSSKLTSDKVQRIRELYIPRIVPQHLLAKAFGVSRSCVELIVGNHRWKCP